MVEIHVRSDRYMYVVQHLDIIGTARCEAHIIQSHTVIS